MMCVKKDSSLHMEKSLYDDDLWGCEERQWPLHMEKCLFLFYIKWMIMDDVDVYTDDDDGDDANVDVMQVPDFSNHFPDLFWRIFCWC